MQIVGYDTGTADLSYDPATGLTGDPSPGALLLADGETVRQEPLTPGRELTFTLNERRCAGHLTEGTHEPCGNQESPYCEQHQDRWPCARCSGECDLPIDACKEEHAVYLAGFAPNQFKVGVTRLYRLHTRLREQGADRAAHIHAVSDGRIARRIERELGESVAEQIPIQYKIKSLHTPMDDAAWTEFLQEYAVIDTFSFTYGLDLSTSPVVETLATGTVEGTKGRILVLAHGNTKYAVDLRDLVGYRIEPDRTSRNLQSSLTTFN